MQYKVKQYIMTMIDCFRICLNKQHRKQKMPLRTAACLDLDKFGRDAETAQLRGLVVPRGFDAVVRSLVFHAILFVDLYNLH